MSFLDKQLPFENLIPYIPRKLMNYLITKVKSAGYETIIIRILFNITSIFSIFLTLISLIILIVKSNYSAIGLLIAIILFSILFLIISLIISWFLVYTFLVLKTHKRKSEVENVLGDYLQLVAANVESGMTIEQSLWYAIRPKFGILAKEIEKVAKKTISGTDLSIALQEFAQAYESDLLKRSIMILIEGLEAGGRLAELLNKISWNIKETQLMKKEISASVTTYAMFIAFSAILAAPFLYALSYRLIIVMTDITSKITMPETSASLPIAATQMGLAGSDFLIFALICLFITSLFASVIVASVKKGDVKSGFRSIPTYMIITYLLFFIVSQVLGKFLAGIM